MALAIAAALLSVMSSYRANSFDSNDSSFEDVVFPNNNNDNHNNHHINYPPQQHRNGAGSNGHARNNYVDDHNDDANGKNGKSSSRPVAGSPVGQPVFGQFFNNPEFADITFVFPTNGNGNGNNNNHQLARINRTGMNGSSGLNNGMLYNGTPCASLPGHRVILSTVCPALRPLLLSANIDTSDDRDDVDAENINGHSQPLIPIHDYPFDVFSTFLHCLYHNAIPDLILGTTNTSAVTNALQPRKHKPLRFLLDLLSLAVDFEVLSLQLYIVYSCLVHRINTATVAVILIKADQLLDQQRQRAEDGERSSSSTRATSALQSLCHEFLLTLPLKSLMSVFQDNHELASEEGLPSLRLGAESVASVMLKSPSVPAPLVEALGLNRIDVVDRLMKMKADPNVAGSGDGTSSSTHGRLPLQIALENGQDEMVACLIRNAGSSILNVRASESRDPMDTLLHVAVRNNNAAHCRLLLEGGANAWYVV